MDDPLDTLSASDTENAARMSLLSFISGLSQQGWCAGWHYGIEVITWDAMHGGDRPYGYTDRVSSILQLLHEEAGGWWWVPDDGEGVVRFIETARWTEVLPAYRTLNMAN